MDGRSGYHDEQGNHQDRLQLLLPRTKPTTRETVPTPPAFWDASKTAEKQKSNDHPGALLSL
jgi:hypothetical protein